MGLIRFFMLTSLKSLRFFDRAGHEMIHFTNHLLKSGVKEGGFSLLTPPSPPSDLPLRYVCVPPVTTKNLKGCEDA